MTRPRRAQVIELLTTVGLALDDDDIADRLAMNRHYVNSVCRTLASEGIITRTNGPGGKLVNRVADPLRSIPSGDAEPAPRSARRRMARGERARRNVDALVATFADCVELFERSAAFAGPSLYFHERALARRHQHEDAASLLADERFIEYIYAVLPAWGMHRMGNQAAKVVEFNEMVASFRAATGPIQRLWDERITEVPTSDAAALANDVWSVIASLSVSRSETRIVAGSKALHHVLPALVPPIDRQYTFRFFTGQKSVQSGDERAFKEWFPYLCEIGGRCRDEIAQAIERGGSMATGPAKVVDNAIIGFMQGEKEA